MYQLAAGQYQYSLRFDQEMVVKRGDVNRACLGVVSFLREDDRNLRPPPEHVGDDGLVAGVKVLDHHHRNRESGRQAAKHMPKSDDPARRCGDGDDAIRLAWLSPGQLRGAHRCTTPRGYAYTR